MAIPNIFSKMFVYRNLIVQSSLLAVGILLGYQAGKKSVPQDHTTQDEATYADEKSHSSSRREKTENHQAEVSVKQIRQTPASEYGNLMQRVLATADPIENQRLLSECLLNMTPDNVFDILKSFRIQTEATGRDYYEEWKLAHFRAGQIAGETALNDYAKLGIETRHTEVWNILYGWATKDNNAALAWLKKAEAEGKKITNDHYAAIIAGAALTNPQNALTLLSSLPADRREDCAGHLIWNCVQNNGTDSLDSVLQYASILDKSKVDENQLASYLYYEAEKKLLWKADHARDVPQAINVAGKMIEHGSDASFVADQAIQTFRWYPAQDKINLIDQIQSRSTDNPMNLDVATNNLLRTMNLQRDEADIRDWMSKNENSALIPYLKKQFP